MALSDRQLVARTFRGQLTKPARDLSPAYVARLARGIRDARARGEKPTRQVARGHRPREVAGVKVTTEHPKEYVRREGRRLYGAEVAKARQAPVRRSPTDRHVAGHAIISARDFTTLYPAWRWARSFDPSTGVQALGFGILQDEWVKRTGSGIPPGAERDPDDDDEQDDEQRPVWRPFYTGNAAGDADENGATFTSYADAKAARDTVFVPGTVEAYIMRRQG